MSTSRFSFAVILAAFLIAGCATGPKFSEYGATVKPVASGYGRIWIYRPSKMAGAAVQPQVYLNGEKVGKAQPGCNFYVDRPAGNYEVKCTTEWSDIGKLTLAAGDEKYVRLGLMVGVVVGHIIPKEVSREVGLREIAHCKLITAQ